MTTQLVQEARLTTPQPPVVRPFPMAAWEVLAVLDRGETQTRRVAKFVPTSRESGLNTLASSLTLGDYCTGVEDSGKVLYSMRGSSWNQVTERLFCQFGAPDDRLWVKETWIPVHHGSYEALDRHERPRSEYTAVIQYAADPGNGYHQCWDSYEGKWRPSAEMPRWASRITLEITSVRIERLQDISEEDAIAEGAKFWPDAPLDPLHQVYAQNAPHWCMTKPESTAGTLHTARLAFANIWNKTNAKSGCAWDNNPWVWVLTHKRIARSY